MSKRYFITFTLVFFLCLTGLTHGAETHAVPSAPVSFGQAKALFDQGAYYQATSLFFQLFKQDPDNPEVNFYLGRASFETDDFETAAMAFERVLIVDPKSVQAKLEMAKSFYRLGAKPTATRYFRELLDGDLPEDIRASINVILSSTKNGEDN